MCLENSLRICQEQERAWQILERVICGEMLCPLDPRLARFLLTLLLQVRYVMSSFQDLKIILNEEKSLIVEAEVIMEDPDDLQ